MLTRAPTTTPDPRRLLDVRVSAQSDTRLVAGLGEHQDEDLWTAFDGRYRPVLMAFGRRLGLSVEDSSDLAQEILAAFAIDLRAGRYDPARGRLRSWLFGIARTRSLKALRQRGREVDWRGVSALEDVRAHDGHLAELWEKEWQRAHLRAGLKALRTQSRIEPRTLRAFEMCCLEGRSPSDVASELGMSVSGVYVAKHRATARLRDSLSQLEEEF